MLFLCGGRRIYPDTGSTRFHRFYFRMYRWKPERRERFLFRRSAVWQFATTRRSKGTRRRDTKLRCGTSAVVQDRNTRYLSPVAPHKAERGRITKRETHKSVGFVTLPWRDIREIRLCIPNKRHLADTWRDTIVFEDARACISLSILSNFNIVATSPGKICFPGILLVFP